MGIPHGDDGRVAVGAGMRARGIPRHHLRARLPAQGCVLELSDFQGFETVSAVLGELKGSLREA